MNKEDFLKRETVECEYLHLSADECTIALRRRWKTVSAFGHRRLARSQRGGGGVFADTTRLANIFHAVESLRHHRSPSLARLLAVPTQLSSLKPRPLITAATGISEDKSDISFFSPSNILVRVADDNADGLSRTPGKRLVNETRPHVFRAYCVCLSVFNLKGALKVWQPTV